MEPVLVPESTCSQRLFLFSKAYSCLQMLGDSSVRGAAHSHVRCAAAQPHTQALAQRRTSK